MAGNTTVFSPPIGDVVLPIDSQGNAELSTVTISTSLSGAAIAPAVKAALAESTSSVVLNGATPVTKALPAITANSVVIFTLKTVGGTVGAYPAIQTITPGTGFTVSGTALDTSTYNIAVIG
jgi:hypothetical protein